VNVSKKDAGTSNYWDSFMGKYADLFSRSGVAAKVLFLNEPFNMRSTSIVNVTHVLCIPDINTGICLYFEFSFIIFVSSSVSNENFCEYFDDCCGSKRRGNDSRA